MKSADLSRMGELMYDSHQSLHRDYEVSCGELNLMVALAQDTRGVYGACMTGDGFGGCTINLVEGKAVNDFERIIAHEYEKITGFLPRFLSQAHRAEHLNREHKSLSNPSQSTQALRDAFARAVRAFDWHNCAGGWLTCTGQRRRRFLSLPRNVPKEEELHWPADLLLTAQSRRGAHRRMAGTASPPRRQ